MYLTAPDWGDLIGAPSGGPDGTPDFEDITAIVNTFQRSITAPNVSMADLAPAIPDQVVNFLDINAGVMAFLGSAYPYAGPSACP